MTVIRDQASSSSAAARQAAAPYPPTSAAAAAASRSLRTADRAPSPSPTAQSPSSTAIAGGQLEAASASASASTSTPTSLSSAAPIQADADADAGMSDAIRAEADGLAPTSLQAQLQSARGDANARSAEASRTPFAGLNFPPGFPPPPTLREGDDPLTQLNALSQYSRTLSAFSERFSSGAPLLPSNPPSSSAARMPPPPSRLANDPRQPASLLNISPAAASAFISPNFIPPPPQSLFDAIGRFDSGVSSQGALPSIIPPPPQALLDAVGRHDFGVSSQDDLPSIIPPPPQSFLDAVHALMSGSQGGHPSGSLPSSEAILEIARASASKLVASQLRTPNTAPASQSRAPSTAPASQLRTPNTAPVQAPRQAPVQAPKKASVGPESINVDALSTVLESNKRALRIPIPHKRSTIILLGMRGVGKTTLGLIASSALGFRFLDADKVLLNHLGMSAQEFISKSGYEEYCNQEATVFESLLAEFPFDAIISCGGSLVDDTRIPTLFFSLKLKHPVIHVVREREEVARYLSLEQNRKRYDEDPVKVWRRREPFFWMSSNCIFANLTQPISALAEHDTSQPRSASRHPLALKSVAQSFLRLLDFVTTDGPGAMTSPPGGTSSSSGRGQDKKQGRQKDDKMMDSVDDIWRRVSALPGIADATDRDSLLRAGQTSYLSLTFPDLRKVDPALFEQVVEGVDAVELRADLLDCMAGTTREAYEALLAEHGVIQGSQQIDFVELAIQIEKARALCKSVNLPLIFTVRTSREGGRYHDDRDHASGSMKSAHSEGFYFLLLNIALSMGVEIIDLELAWAPEATKQFASRRGNSKIMCSYHDLVGALRWDSPNARALYDRASSFDPDLVELIGTALRVDQNWHLLSFASHVNAAAAADSSRPPLIAINMGQIGQPSRPFQPILSPVGHPAQPSVAAPGQLSLQEMTEIAGKLGIIKPRKFVLFSGVRGDNGSGSSPDLVQARVLRQAIQRIGLPYSVNIEMESGRMTMLDRFRDDSFGGAALPAHTYELQSRLFEIVKQEDLTFSMTEEAIVVGAVDQVCLAELEPEGVRVQGNQRRQEAHAVPRCVAHHSLPHALERCLTDHFSPLNKPGRDSSAVIVLPQSDAWHVGLTIGLRSAARAVKKLGFGHCAVVVCGSYPGMDLSELTNFVRPPSEDADGEGTCFELQPSSALVDLPRNMKASSRSHLSESDRGAEGPSEGSSNAASRDATKQPEETIRTPSAVILIGGSEAQHDLALSSIFHDNEQPFDSSLSPSERADLPLPAELWNGPLGGVCISIPTTTTTATTQFRPPTLEAKLLKRGWISVSSAQLEFERLAHGIFEPWTRKRAPKATMRTAYLRALGSGCGGGDEQAIGVADGGDTEMEVDGHVEVSGTGKGKGKGKERDQQGAAEALAGMRYG
ncbi:unnamed protein product [Tilletia laevis]|uniref:3-dehydroquinate dehydratase n=3 Tax=Tilletia TaxID=13289 RepID=A0A8X7MY41_9BASI|nr:hypothetical protein CF336_g1257 [Tilletia laevis]KAE8204264.1 hypothetical protein CF328_g1180 [Tilletia controversa]KAE8264591.1 hypothetical protein A4X03_0g837 [Tilletia caries]KAE8207487.1 hypothetical protein CF335_g1104 [Tilletia laevis]KAE8253239.1 hypothetical protein A4X06_0g1602 [Tilletia controversa]